MKSKTLITMAVASTFGWSAAAFAGSGHEVMTPLSVNESGEVLISQEQGFGSKKSIEMASASSVDTAIGGLSESYSRSSGFFDSGETASLTPDESLALGADGVYSDFYVVSWTPIVSESWDYYVIDTSGVDQLAAIEESYLLLPTHELALIPSQTDEMVYELALVPITFDAMSDAALGE